MGRALRIATLWLFGLSGACSGGTGDAGEPAAAFQYRSSEDLGLHVSVTKYGIPVVGASVSVVEAVESVEAAESGGSGRPFFVGGTGIDGVCDSVVSIPTSVDRVDVVVHHDGSRGPFGDEMLRAHWGPFAPSSRTTVRVADLGDLAVALEDR